MAQQAGRILATIALTMVMHPVQWHLIVFGLVTVLVVMNFLLIWPLLGKPGTAGWMLDPESSCHITGKRTSVSAMVSGLSPGSFR